MYSSFFCQLDWICANDIPTSWGKVTLKEEPLMCISYSKDTRFSLKGGDPLSNVWCHEDILKTIEKKFSIYSHRAGFIKKVLNCQSVCCRGTQHASRLK